MVPEPSSERLASVKHIIVQCSFRSCYIRYKFACCFQRLTRLSRCKWDSGVGAHLREVLRNRCVCVSKAACVRMLSLSVNRMCSMVKRLEVQSIEFASGVAHGKVATCLY